MLADNETVQPPPAPSSPARSYREALLSPPPGGTQETMEAVPLTLPPAGTPITAPADAPAAATAGRASVNNPAAPAAAASRKRTAASAASASNAMRPAKRAGPNRSVNAQAIADAEEHPELRETPITLKIPGFLPIMFKELTQELLATFGLDRNLSPLAPSNPISSFHIDGDDVTFVCKNREATAKFLNTSFVFRGRPFPWSTEKGTLLAIGIVNAPLKATARRLKAAFAQFGKLTQLLPLSRDGWRTGDWKAFLELRDGNDLPAHVVLKSCEGRLARVVPASELVRCHKCGLTHHARCRCAPADGATETGVPVSAIATPATLLAAESASAEMEKFENKNKKSSAAGLSQAKSAAPTADTAARPTGMQVPLSAGLISSIAMGAENSVPRDDAGKAASPVASTEQTCAPSEDNMDVYMSDPRNPLKRNNRTESDNESPSSVDAQGFRRTAPSASGIHGVKTRAQSKATPVASDGDPGSSRY
ncbi:hypothetical protein COEREDRAFT_12720 [Coemansia reversa NRRL 1564]|uniref:Uncharacterized protein n=1 Tax=Coemansia reversa (strain ATCC 12441 / NRRL 1564) TaxID=763665 RepID=A0A2G5B0E3_COERN|nr:hypothetical protein COEREDRAFT_12720 [Coemansia reversa NRRL 1564]|eukprot:PIA12492.1 hypothetical protein COEREDRAFT_12720 [Coemansia reversa NRRL 1564]